MHYRPRTLILNNLEYDHADIYPDVAAIQRQFNHLLRTVPGAGRIVCNGADAELAPMLAGGLLDAARDVRPVERARRIGAPRVGRLGVAASSRCCGERKPVARVRWPLLGAHNVDNALAAHRGRRPRRRRRPSAARALV